MVQVQKFRLTCQGLSRRPQFLQSLVVMVETRGEVQKALVAAALLYRTRRRRQRFAGRNFVNPFFPKELEYFPVETAAVTKNNKNEEHSCYLGINAEF